MNIKWVIGYFWLKVLAAAGYGYYHLLTRQGGDTWAYHRYGLEETALLRSDPVRFFTSVFHSGYGSYGGLFETENSFWNDLDANTIPKFLAVCNLLSGSNYYINAIFVNLFFLPGTVLLFKTWKTIQPNLAPFWQYLPFLVPSFVFWTSGIHKEGFLVLGIALAAHAFFGYPERSGNKFSRALQVITGVCILLALRNFLLLPLGTALLAWVCTRKMGLSPAANLGLILLLLCIGLWGSHYFSKPDAAGILYERRAAFLKNKGNSGIAGFKLEPTPASLLRNAPAAFIIGTFRPLPPADINNLASGAAAAENLCLLLFSCWAFYRLHRACWQHPFLYFCLYFSVSCFLIIGYTVPFLGAVVRYRSVAIPFWIMALLLIGVCKTNSAGMRTAPKVGVG